MMRNLAQTTVIVLVLSLLVAGAAVATTPEQFAEQFNTPDDMTPAMEDICDETTGKANGLCVAYCEAMDCDSENPNANATACIRVGENFTRLTGELPPCERACPCWEEAELEIVTAENQFVISCLRLGGLVIQTSFAQPGIEGGFTTAPTSPGGSPTCGTRDLPPFRVEITEDEFEVCNAQIRARCEAIGTPIP